MQERVARARQPQDEVARGGLWLTIEGRESTQGLVVGLERKEGIYELLSRTAY